MKACECSCTPETEYADGSKPSFYTDSTKAAYWWNKLRSRALEGAARVNSELAVDPPYRASPNGWRVYSRAVPLSTLKGYNLYLGVHLNGLHVLSV